MSLLWSPNSTLSVSEQQLCKLMKRTGKLFVFLRLQRHVIFDELLQHKLEQIHTPSADEATTVPAALLVMVMLLQAYTKCSDDEAVRRAAMDKAWQMVLDCNGKSHAPFSKKTLVNARKKLIELDLESHVLRRTADIARQDKGFDHKKIGKLRIAIDSAPLAGAGRVEDTLNLLGSALAVWLSTVATLVMVPAERIIEEAGLQLLTSSSIKAGMDLDWASPDAVTRGLHQMKSEIERAQTYPFTRYFQDRESGLGWHAHARTLPSLRAYDFELAHPPVCGRSLRLA